MTESWSEEDSIYEALIESYVSDEWPDNGSTFSWWHFDPSVKTAFIYVSDNFTEQQRFILQNVLRTINKKYVIGIVTNNKKSGTER